MRVLVCGDRCWADPAPILRELRRHRATVVIHGGARGADTLAGEAAQTMKVPVEVFPAQWNLYGKSAGPIRNKQMLVEGGAGSGVGFPHGHHVFPGDEGHGAAG